MAQYETGIQTRNQILEACRSLFYEKGFDATTYVDIAKRAGVNQGSIHYHYASKENLLKIILDETISKNNSIVDDYAAEDTADFTKYFLSIELYLYKMALDGKYRQFNLDASRLLSPENFNDLLNSQSNQYYDGRNYSALPMSEQFEVMACLAFDIIVRIFFVQHIENSDYQEIKENCLDIYRRIMKIDDAEIEIVKQQLSVLESKVPWDGLDTTLDPTKKYL